MDLLKRIFAIAVVWIALFNGCDCIPQHRRYQSSHNQNGCPRITLWYLGSISSFNRYYVWGRLIGYFMRQTIKYEFWVFILLLGIAALVFLGLPCSKGAWVPVKRNLHSHRNF